MRKNKISIFRFLVIVILSLSLVIPETVHAEIMQDLNSKNVTVAIATVENLTTGEIQYYNLNKVSATKMYSTQDDSLTESYEVFIPLDNPFIIRPLDNTGGTQTSYGVTATLNVEYEVNSTNEQVKAKRVYGSWTPSATFYYLENRYVMLHAGTMSGNKIEKYPTQNSFSYTTGWGFNYRYWGDLSPRAISEANVRISGMSSYNYLITVDVPYS